MPTLRASVELLQKIPIFASLTEDELKTIVDSPDNGIMNFKPLEAIIEEDEFGDCMYIILEGAVDVRIKAVGGREITIATLKTGEFFGEQALLPGATGKRNASVRALQSSQLFKITKKDVALGISHDDELSFVAENIDDAPEADRVKMLLLGVRLFRSLSKKDLDRIDSWTDVVSYDAGEIIVRETEDGDFMYIVLDGSVEVFVVDDDGQIVVLAELFKGNYFGEQALLPDGSGKRNANVRANGPAILVKVAKKYFQLIVNHDNKLMLALKAMGEAQQDKIVNAIGQRFDW
ncbi:MAG: cyclic nucleotide-binding domain-containing protein [Proteobacteria bacterium]|nr:MAG: cyclic nucleotide-binding domain-containing protein [Pseudomonadota bacterium]